MNDINTWIIDYETNNIRVCITKEKNNIEWRNIPQSNSIKCLKISELTHLTSTADVLLYENTSYYIGVIMPTIFFESKYRKDAKNVFYNQFVNNKISFFPQGMYEKSDGGLVNIIGEFKTESNVGIWDFSIKLNDLSITRDVEVYLPVHPNKINFETEYMTMLDDISSEVSELLVKYTTSNTSQIELESSNQTTNFKELYIHLRQCVYELIMALEEIKLRPYIKAEQIKKTAYTGAHSNIDTIELASNYMRYEPQKGGPLRQRLRGTTPITVPEIKNHLTYDNLPNQYLKFVIHSFVNILIDANKYFSGKDTYSLYCKEINEWLEYFEENLHYTFLKMVTLKSNMTMNFNSQVLYRRHGYKELFRIVEKYNNTVRFNLPFSDVETDKYYVKPVYELYEMWCFLVLKKILSRLIGPETSQNIIVSVDSRISINLKSGLQSLVTFEHNAKTINLYYNKSYPSPKDSYSLPYRPDISIECVDPDSSVTKIYHFDAKYKVEKTTQNMEGKNVEVMTYTKNDIYKMHAYRDSIYNTVSAYVLYPGEESVFFAKQSNPDERVGACRLVPGRIKDVEDLETKIRTLLSI